MLFGILCLAIFLIYVVSYSLSSDFCYLCCFVFFLYSLDEDHGHRTSSFEDSIVGDDSDRGKKTAAGELVIQRQCSLCDRVVGDVSVP